MPLLINERGATRFAQHRSTSAMGECNNILTVKVDEPAVVQPAEATGRRVLYLSNIDQVLVFTLETLHFFGDSRGIDAAEALRSALSKALVHYDFLAGRLRMNAEERRLEIDCNGAGALFAAASSDQTVQDLGDLTRPNPSFAQLILQRYRVKTLEDLPLCFLQVTRFKCGGFAIGLGINHGALDGIAIAKFLRNLASLARGEGLAAVPYSDRGLLKARSPPRIEYRHPELIRVEDIVTHEYANGSGSAKGGSEVDTLLSIAGAEPPDEGHVFELFHVSKEMLRRIKTKAAAAAEGTKCSSFEAVTAHLWRARTMAVEMNPGEISRVLFAVDLRSRMKPPLPEEYAGNAVLFAYASASAQEIAEEPLSFCVGKVREGVARMTDDYIRSCIDWGEVFKGIPCSCRKGNIAVSSWWRLGFEEVEYPWGKPLYCGPVIHPTVDIVLLLPSLHGADAVNVYLSLKSHQMPKFQRAFLAV